MDPKGFAKQLESLAALDEPLRRKLYLYVVKRDEEVSRDEAARATRVSRALAAFHLDKLVKAGLLEASFRRLSGRGGPGAGRPSKLYRRASTQIDLTLPRRRYELAAQVLTQAMAKTRAEDRMGALRSSAREWGEKLAQDVPSATGHRSPMAGALHALEVCGFEPSQTGDGEIELRNCPFGSLPAVSRDLICGMNLALIEGLLAGLKLRGIRARLAPRAGMCCVALRKA